ncbi:hypothetical protein GIB67_016297 [Kingdonia uniflora]|uniref:Uncharacterized protein n=1 Tax=Kingdonia uniflora TaxID=39325 RepID=A0A7J7M9C6_9MAGN|nr:hypothetical protein GIB67_016297 [Kingdonia uniflora]
MQLALPCISEGALSLDGGMVRSQRSPLVDIRVGNAILMLLEQVGISINVARVANVVALATVECYSCRGNLNCKYYFVVLCGALSLLQSKRIPFDFLKGKKFWESTDNYIRPLLRKVIPRQLCDNAGFGATDVLNKLRQKHALLSGEGALYGVDVNTGGITDSFANFVWEPTVVKFNVLNAVTEVACLVLGVDETVKNPKVCSPGFA